MIQHAYFSTNPGTRLEDWNDDYARLIMNPVERTFTGISNNASDPQEQETTFTEWEAETLLIPKPITYEKIIESLIRTRYSISDEFGFLRQRDVKPDEFQVYNLFVESCKDIAKELGYNPYN